MVSRLDWHVGRTKQNADLPYLRLWLQAKGLEEVSKRLTQYDQVNR